MFSALHECGHVSLWRSEGVCPNRGERLTCGNCGQPTRVTDVLGPWRAECRDCRRLNGHATFRKTVEKAAVSHVQTWTSHRVRLWQFGDKGSVTFITAATHGAQPMLPGTEGAPF